MKNKPSIMIGLKMAAGSYLIYLNFINQGGLDFSPGSESTFGNILSIIYYIAGGLLIFGAFRDLSKLKK